MWPRRCGGGCVPLITTTITISAMSTTTATTTITTLTTRLACGPDFAIARSNGVTETRLLDFRWKTTFAKGEILPWVANPENCPLMPLHGRFLHGGGSCHIPFHVQGQSRLDGTLQFICTKGEYLFLWQAKNGMKQDTSAAKQSGKRENRPGVMPLGLWKRSFPIAKCSSMGRSAVTGYGGNRVFRTLKDTCFQERPTDGGRFWIKTGSLWNVPTSPYVSGAKYGP